MQSGPIWAVKIIFHLFFYNKELQLLKLLADLGVNVILVSTPAKHCITSIILILTVLKLEL